jgi:hypothetical protein
MPIVLGRLRRPTSLICQRCTQFATTYRLYIEGGDWHVCEDCAMRHHWAHPNDYWICENCIKVLHVHDSHCFHCRLKLCDSNFLINWAKEGF